MIIDPQKNIKEFSVQAFRKMCDAMVISPPEILKSLSNWDDKRFLILDELYKKVTEYAGGRTASADPGERPGQFGQTLLIIDALNKYWRVNSMNLETIIDEFVINAIGRE